MAEQIWLRGKLMDGGTPQEMKRARAEWDAFQREKPERDQLAVPVPSSYIDNMPVNVRRFARLVP